MTPGFDVDERLSESKDRGLGVDIPVPLHERVEALCELVYDAGYDRPSKRKMVAALLLAATDDPRELDELLRAYDRGRVKDSLVGEPEIEGNVVSFPQRGRGPRVSRPR
jgi:hypothetical protein